MFNLTVCVVCFVVGILDLTYWRNTYSSMIALGIANLVLSLANGWMYYTLYYHKG